MSKPITSKDNATMYLRGHFQNAYVTRDLDRALGGLRDRYDVQAEPIRFDPDMTVSTPAGPRHMQLRAALVWLDTVQLELIEPVAGFLEPYADHLPDRADGLSRLHHVCVRREDPVAMQAEIDRLGLPRSFEFEHPDGYFVYVDARETLGHYLEFAWATPQGWAMQGWPPSRGL